METVAQTAQRRSIQHICQSASRQAPHAYKSHSSMIPNILCAEQALVRWTRSAYPLSSCVHWIHHEPMVHTELLPDYSQMWPYLRKGPISGQCKHVGTGENAQNRRFTPQMWPYLRKGPISGQCKRGYGRKRAKLTFHTIMAYCIIRTYGAFPTFWPSLKPILISCISNKDRTVSLRG